MKKKYVTISIDTDAGLFKKKVPYYEKEKRDNVFRYFVKMTHVEKFDDAVAKFSPNELFTNDPWADKDCLDLDVFGKWVSQPFVDEETEE